MVLNRLDDTSLGVNDFCRAVHLINMQGNRKLKALTGQTPSRLIRSIRLQKAKGMLDTSQLNFCEIAYQGGLIDPNDFSHVFFLRIGMKPNAIRKYHIIN